MLSGAFFLMYLLLLLDKIQSKLKEKRWERKRRRPERINYFSLADKSFPDLLCSTFFSKAGVECNIYFQTSLSFLCYLEIIYLVWTLNKMECTIRSWVQIVKCLKSKRKSGWREKTIDNIKTFSYHYTNSRDSSYEWYKC